MLGEKRNEIDVCWEFLFDRVEVLGINKFKMWGNYKVKCGNKVNEFEKLA